MKIEDFKVKDTGGKPYADGEYRDLNMEELVSLIKLDYEKFLEKKNKAAGVRCRKRLQELKAIINRVRDNIQEIKLTF